VDVRPCDNGRVQREWMRREDISSPTVNIESTSFAKSATCDIPNARIQAQLEDVKQEET
jgi:hypothetical protein